MSAALQTYPQLQYRTTSCITCGITICLPEDYYAERVKDHKLYYCPNGHTQHFVGKTPEEQLRAELEEQRRKTTEAWEEAAREAALRKREVRAAKAKMTRLRHRIGNGVCPCCNRTFHNLQQHMTKEHPAFQQPEPDIGAS